MLLLRVYSLDLLLTTTTVVDDEWHGLSVPAVHHAEEAISITGGKKEVTRSKDETEPIYTLQEWTCYTALKNSKGKFYKIKK
ncbi:hypothetical protein ILYODFUR_006456 [Ilyodon furcidens]|uniref:Uncharacterized protein n=1 Tax=Ilyodon furcidens TaxID=33524 RepID=A0ABV0T5Q1_9TELE